MTEDVCNLNKKCADPRNDSLLKCTGLNCTNVIHELCGQRIRTTFHNIAKTDEEKGIVFLEADVICSKKCFNAIVKTKLIPKKVTLNTRWSNDGPNDFLNSQSIVMDWITTEGNYNRYRGGDKQNVMTKASIASSIATEFFNKIGVKRLGKDVENKIQNFEALYKKASDWKGATGAGISDPGKVEEYLRKLCPYYFELQPIMESRHTTRPLLCSGSHIASYESKQSNNSDIESEDDNKRNDIISAEVDGLTTSEDECCSASDKNINTASPKNFNNNNNTSESFAKTLETMFSDDSASKTQRIQTSRASSSGKLISKRIISLRKGTPPKRKKEAMDTADQLIDLKYKQLDDDRQYREDETKKKKKRASVENN